MFDPAAMGTLRIGLDGDPAEARTNRRQASAAASHRARGGIRVAFVGVLRRLADALEPRTVGEAAN
jgi:hypothetical protein